MTTVIRETELQQMCTDVLTTAVEGGIGYWSCTTSYRWDCPVDERHVSIIDAEAYSMGAYSQLFVDDHGDVDPDERTGEPDPDFWHLTVGLVGVELAMHRIAWTEWGTNPEAPSQHVRAWCRSTLAQLERGKLWTDLDESSEFDAADADQILQVAALGTVVYG